MQPYLLKEPTLLTLIHFDVPIKKKQEFRSILNHFVSDFYFLII